MESVDKLREWMKSPLIILTEKAEEHLLEMLDAIEDEALSMRDLAWNEGFDAGFASADDWLADNEEVMAEHGWVRGPIGADGKPMAKEHMVVDNGGNVGVIVETRFNDSNWLVLVDFGEGESARFVCFLPESLTHYHKPTVEDVLREFGRGWHEQMSGPETFDIADYVERYAARLQLKEEA